MNNSGNSPRKVMMPYHDVRDPFKVGAGGAFADYIARDIDYFEELEIGAMVVIWDPAHNAWLTGRVVELSAVSPFNPQKESMLYHEDEFFNPTAPLEEVTGPHTHQPMIAKIRLLREMTKQDQEEVAYISRAVLRPPSARSKLWFPDVRNDSEPDLYDILEIREQGLRLGFVGQGNVPIQKKEEFLSYRWDVDNLDNKHISIVGESGSGKTVLLKHLAYELCKHFHGSDDSLRVIMTDVQGDISQLLFGGHEKLKKFSIKREGWRRYIEEEETLEQAIQHFGKTQLVFPVAGKGRSLSEHAIALKELARNVGCKVTEIGLRLQDLSAPSDVEYLFNVTSEQVALLLDEVADSLQDENIPASIQYLKKSINKKLAESDSNTDQHRTKAGTPYYSSTLKAALRALRSLGEYFDHHQSSMRSENNPLDCFDFDGITILYLEELSFDERIMWEMQLLQWLYRNKSQKHSVFAFFDEAHQIIPATPAVVGGAKGTFDRLRMNFERLAREGRKFGINLVLSTQSPSDLHQIVPDMCFTKIVMKVSPRNAKVAEVDSELAPVATRFGHGEFLIQSPFNGTPDWTRVHSPTPPVLHASMTEWWEKVLELARAL